MDFIYVFFGIFNRVIIHLHCVLFVVKKFTYNK